MSDDYPVLDPGPGRDAEGVRLRRGGCGCGAVRFEVRGEPMMVGLCHCTECRKATGSAFFAYANFPPDAITITGDYKTHRGRSFCPVCGGRVFHLSADQAEIALGALDEVPSGLEPRQEGWIRRREHWLGDSVAAIHAMEDP